MARRALAAALILVSLALTTIYLREPNEGGLHAAQRLGLSALAPFQEAGERIARPFQDAYSYMSDLVSDKSDRDELENRIAELEQQVQQYATASGENERLKELLAYVEGPRVPDGFDTIVARVIGQPANAYSQRIIVAAGSEDGVEVSAPVVTAQGLVGLVTSVLDGQAQITLLTDQSIAVSATVLADVGTGADRLAGRATGVIRPSRSAGAGLLLDQVEKEDPVEVGDRIITSGWRSGALSSLYPYGIPIGTVTSVGRQDIDLFTRVQVEPFVNFDELFEVVILVPR
jgi:rod shape-determining protein MreC